MKRLLLNLLGALAMSSALNLQLSTAFAQSTGFRLLTTFANPTPAAGDNFGYYVAAVGTDRVLIGAMGDDTGATDAGAAYLFGTNGVLLTTFTNPTPAVRDWFGMSVAAVGTDRVLIGAIGDDTGATNTGAAYLFSTNGALLTVFTNPTPGNYDYFSYSMAAVGTDRVLISAYNDDTGANNAGAVYLFSTEGVLLTTFTNPLPSNDDNFGWSVAAAETDRVLIGSPLGDAGAVDAGVVYLFSTNGTLLTTFTNPVPTGIDYFGGAVVAVGNDLALVAAPFNTTGGTDAGAAYLFSTNGALLTTFTNPAPTDPINLGGWSMVAVGRDRLLIPAPADPMHAPPDTSIGGVAYLFSTNGALLTSLTNPTPSKSDGFGVSVAAMGTDRVLIGACFGDEGGTDAGAVYLFSLVEQTPERASLTIHLTPTNTVAVSWPLLSTGWTLQENTNGVASVNWSNVPGPIQDNGTAKTLIVNPATESRFYRLFKP